KRNGRSSPAGGGAVRAARRRDRQRSQLGQGALTMPHVRAYKVTPRWQVLLVFGVVAVSLIAGVLLIFGTIDAERKQRVQVTKTNAVLAELGILSRAAINGEAGQRGYFIALDRRYLGPYTAARELYPAALERLRERIGMETTD